MINLLGIHTEKLELPPNEFVGNLLFAEFSTTVIFSDEDNNPIVKEWVDCSDDGKIDRYFYYKSSKFWLKKFINGDISHQDLILNSLDGLLHFQDESNSETSNNYILSNNYLPNQYKPSSDFFLNEDDAVEIDQIKDFFELEKVADDISIKETIKEISLAKKSETLNIHLHQGKGIGFGTVNTEILGKTLTKFDKLYRDVAFDILLGKNRGETKLTKSKKEKFNPYVSTEVYWNIAASYSVLIRPKNSEYDLFNNTSNTEIIAQRIFLLMNNSEDSELLKEEYLQHSDFTMNSYKAFLRNIYELELNLELNWFSPTNFNELDENINFKEANTRLKIIENLNVVNNDKFTKTGKFRALNCDTGHYNFVSNDNEQFNGYFDKLIKDGSDRINFIDIYEIKVSRQIKKEPGNSEAKITDTIIAFYKKD
ncbi:hypothetical protein ABF174_002330 [Flavobacterium psychrophilum]